MRKLLSAFAITATLIALTGGSALQPACAQTHSASNPQSDRTIQLGDRTIKIPKAYDRYSFGFWSPSMAPLDGGSRAANDMRITRHNTGHEREFKVFMAGLKFIPESERAAFVSPSTRKTNLQRFNPEAILKSYDDELAEIRTSSPFRYFFFESDRLETFLRCSEPSVGLLGLCTMEGMFKQTSVTFTVHFPLDNLSSWKTIAMNIDTLIERWSK